VKTSPVFVQLSNAIVFTFPDHSQKIDITQQHPPKPNMTKQNLNKQRIRQDKQTETEQEGKTVGV
jgi:hypothetical protein